ncbi:MAG: KTSC domain-containing protein [Anaerolineaceae bacterium]|nr:KTSC domain-containing protein [Anaerolineaceae bacterium]
MNRNPVVSSNIMSIGYDATRMILEIEFKGGSLYQYSNVPLDVYEGLMAAGSHGRFFATYIKNGGYPCKKIG